MNPEIIGSFIRHALTLAGGWAVTKGYTNNNTVETIIGGAVALYALWWSIMQKRQGANRPPGGPALLCLLATAVAITAAGCASFKSVVTKADGSKVETTCWTLFDSKSQLAKSTSSQGTSTNRQSVAISGLEQESQSTAVTALVESITAGIIKGMGK